MDTNNMYDTHENMNEMCVDRNYNINFVHADGSITKSGSWIMSAKYHTIYNRSLDRPWINSSDLGFRMLKETNDVK